MNPKTFEYRGYKWSDIKSVPLSELKKYPIGESLNDFGASENPPEIYYPESEKPYPFKGLKGLLTLNPVPANAQIVKDLEFNAIMQYTNATPSWDGDLITVGHSNKTILRFTGDEPDCRGYNPDKVYQKYLEMKQETPDIPVGLNLCSDIGCGLKGTCPTIKEYQEKWLRIASKVDYVSLNIYPYRSDWPDPLAKMEEFYHFWNDNLTVPIIPIIQAHWITDGLTKPNPIEQVKFWFSKKMSGYVVYCWRDEFHGCIDMQNEWRGTNEWAKNNI